MTTHPSALIAQLRAVAKAQKAAEDVSAYSFGDTYERVHLGVREEVEVLRPLLAEFGISLHHLREGMNA
jgi:hypothetical protein